MKRIIVACDGTGQSASRGPWAISTNVSRICHALLNSTTSAVQQLVFYQSGVGTQDLGFGSVGTVVQGAFGEGVEDHVADGYEFLINNYVPGDELFFFGFSRGAFTARVLSNIVARLGVLSKKYSWCLKDAMAAFKEGPEAFDEYIRDLQVKVEKDKYYWKPERGEYVPRVHRVKIKVVGCWDTVASLGYRLNPFTNPGGVVGEYRHFDGGLAEGIENAFHALALDEVRGPFTPTLWYLPQDEEVAKSINLRQCWFPGVHTNVGGGYPDQAIANLTLAWMIDLCRPFLDFDHTYMKMVVDLDHNPWKINSKKRQAHPDGPPDKEYQGWGCGKIYDSYAKGQTYTWRYRTPGAYSTAEHGQPGSTNETIHASVRDRWFSKRFNPPWRPASLKGFSDPEEDGNGRGEWAKRSGGGRVSNIWGHEGSSVTIKEDIFPAFYPVVLNNSCEWQLRYAPVEPPKSK